MRKVLTVPNAILRKKCKPVKEITPEIVALASELEELLAEKQGEMIRCSISASQVGESIRLFVYRNNPYTEIPGTLAVINPELVYAKKEVTLRETCLSIPNKAYLVKRHKRVKIKALGLDGNYRIHKGTGIVAQIIEHEMNHLDGVLIDTIGSKVE